MRIRLTISHLSRREIAFAAVAGILPLSACWQESRKVAVIGFLGPSTSSFAGPWLSAFVDRLRELGWVEGHNVAIERRWAEGRPERFAEIAAEFVRLKVDVILAPATTTVIAAKQATSVIPIVFSAAADPVGAGLVESLSRPGGNVTGISLQQTDLASKRLQFLADVIPGFSRLAILVNVRNPAAVFESHQAKAVAASIGVQVKTVEIERAEDISPAFDAFKDRVDALYVGADPLINATQAKINNLARAARLPTIFNGREYVVSGGLMSYGPNIPDLYRRAADLVDKILRGTKPANIPVEQATKFDFVLNLTTAKLLELKVPPKVFALASEVIE